MRTSFRNTLALLFSIIVMMRPIAQAANLVWYQSGACDPSRDYQMCSNAEDGHCCYVSGDWCNGGDFTCDDCDGMTITPFNETGDCTGKSPAGSCTVNDGEGITCCMQASGDDKVCSGHADATTNGRRHDGKACLYPRKPGILSYTPRGLHGELLERVTISNITEENYNQVMALHEKRDYHGLNKFRRAI